MKKVLRFFLWSLIAVALGGALLGYFVYSPTPEVPRLSGKLLKGTLEVGGLKRTYLTYVPQGLAKGAPLVVAMHGSGQNSAQMRRATGYGFERLADERGFAVVYPDGYEGYWNACNIVGDYSANKLNIDDVGFLTGMIDKLITEIGVDRGRVFAVGLSRGGHMAFRLALEAPSRFRAVAAAAANVPAQENFKCKPAGHGTSSVMIMNGTKDPLNPFDGGEVKFFGLLKRGKVRSSRESGQFFADLNGITGKPETKETPATDIGQVLWRNGSNVEVELMAIHGGGHGMPQPYTRYPRLLGPTLKEPNGPAVIWAFFERQWRRARNLNVSFLNLESSYHSFDDIRPDVRAEKRTLYLFPMTAQQGLLLERWDADSGRWEQSPPRVGCGTREHPEAILALRAGQRARIGTNWQSAIEHRDELVFKVGTYTSRAAPGKYRLVLQYALEPWPRTAKPTGPFSAYSAYSPEFVVEPYH